MTTPTKKSWKELRTVRLIQLSPTQLETFDLCKRKWWLKNVRKLRSSKTESQTFGTVLHGVAERYYLADNLGRDANGNPVELYPPGWDHATNRYTGQDEGNVTPAEADTIRRLITAAIDEGVLERKDGRMIEIQFKDDLLMLKCPICEGSGHVKCPTCKGESTVAIECIGEQGIQEDFAQCPDCQTGITKCPLCEGDGKGDRITVEGFIDHLTPDGVEDHKTTKAMKWAKSKNELLKNIQINVYAKQLLDWLVSQGKPLPAKIYLRHNVFCKDQDDLRVRKTEVYTSPEDVYSFWETLKVMAQEMSQLRRTANGWHQCPPPANMAHACQAYGGCDFRAICSGHESEEDYEKRLARQQEMLHNIQNSSVDASKGTTTDIVTDKLAAAVAATVPETEPVIERATTMGLMDQLKQRANAANGGAVAQPQPPASVAPAVAAAAVEPPMPTGTGTDTNIPAPWANPNCAACKGLGFDTQGNPCRICDVSSATTRQRHPSGKYEIVPVAGGLAYWKFKGTEIEGVCPMSHNTAAPTVQHVVQAPAPVAPTPVAAPVAAPVQALPSGRMVIQPAPVAPVAAPVVPTPVAVATTAEGAKRERAKKKFTLVINAVATEGSGPSPKVTRMVDTFAAVSKELGTKAGKPYHDLDAFGRRDEMAKVAELVAEGFGTDFVVVDLANATPDMKAFVEAIRPYAGVEIVGVPN